MARQRAKATGRFIGALDAIGRIQLVWSGIAVLIPILASFTTGVFGFLEHEPVMWIVTACALVLFGGLGGSWYLLGIRQNLTSMGKLRYVNTFIANELIDVKPGKTRAITKAVIDHRHLNKVQIGVHLLNTAHFDISAYVESANTSMEDMTPPRVDYPKPAVIIRPGQVITMVDEMIDMRGKLCQNMRGRLDMKVKYGAPGRERYDLQFAGDIQMTMRNTGQMVGVWTVWDAANASTSPS